MGINFALARKKFNQTQEKLRKQYKEAGMTEKEIDAMYQLDLHQFNRDIAYQRHTQCLDVLAEPEMNEEGYSPLLCCFADQLTVYQQPSEKNKYWWLDEIEDEALLERLLMLPVEDLELIDQLAFQGLSQTEIGLQMSKSQSSISQRISTIRKRLKK